jgi:hypothetical protein
MVPSGVRTARPVGEAAVHAARIVIAAEAALGRRVVRDAGTVVRAFTRCGCHGNRADEKTTERRARERAPEDSTHGIYLDVLAVMVCSPDSCVET